MHRAPSCTSTWTRFTRRWSSATGPSCAASRSSSAAPAIAAWSRRPATKCAKFGVRSAMPIREALRRCPHAICVKPRMSVYREVSHQVFAVFHEYTPVVEGLSLDEAFLDVTASLALKGDAVTIARGIKQRIRATTQLAASVGVAPNKLVAKIASELEKPDGLTVMNHRQHARGPGSALGAPPARSRPEVRRTRRGRGTRHVRAAARGARCRVVADLRPGLAAHARTRVRHRRAAGDVRVGREVDQRRGNLLQRSRRSRADAGRSAAARRPRRHAHARAESRCGLRGGQDPARRFHHLHAAEALRAFHHRLAHHRQDRRRAARRRGSPSSRARRCGC